LKANLLNGGPIIWDVTADTLAYGKIQAMSEIIELNGTNMVGADIKEVSEIVKASATLNFVFAAELAPKSAIGTSTKKKKKKKSTKKGREKAEAAEAASDAAAEAAADAKANASTAAGEASDLKKAEAVVAAAALSTTGSTKSPASKLMLNKYVMVDGYDQRGVVRFAGVHAESGAPRYGVELSAPVGNNNGTVKGHTYFTCPDKHGVLVSTSKVMPWSDGNVFSVSGSGATIDIFVGGKNLGTLSDMGELKRVKKGTPEGHVKKGYIGKRVYQFENNKDVYCIADKKTGAVMFCDRMFKETPTGRQYAWSMPPNHPYEGKFEDRETSKTTKWPSTLPTALWRTRSFGLFRG